MENGREDAVGLSGLEGNAGLNAGSGCTGARLCGHRCMPEEELPRASDESYELPIGELQQQNTGKMKRQLDTPEFDERLHADHAETENDKIEHVFMGKEDGVASHDGEKDDTVRVDAYLFEQEHEGLPECGINGDRRKKDVQSRDDAPQGRNGGPCSQILEQLQKTGTERT